MSRLAGDVVISYGLQERFFHGQTFVELIETTYIAFRQAIERMLLNNTCRCNACANFVELDLKFFVHYGEFGVQRLGNHDELVGADVIVIHRLLKNHVTAQTGIPAYALYTDAAIWQLELQDICATMLAHTEAYEHLGEIQLWVQDLRPVWRAWHETNLVTIPANQVGLRVEVDIALPPEIVWDHLAKPEFRSTLMGSDRQVTMGRKHGRVAPGSIYQCYHGDQLITQTILEWHPFELMVTQDLLPIPIRGTSVLVELRLTPNSTGTHLVETFSRTKGPWLGRLLANLVLPTRASLTRKNVAAFKQRLEASH